MPYIGKSPQFGVRSRFYYTQSSAGGTSVSGTDDNGKTLKFSDGEFVDVMLNGVTLVAGTDYNTTTANTIGSLAALSNGDVVEVIVYDTFSVADTVSAKDGGTFSGNMVMGGTLSVTGASTLTGGVSGSLTVANGITLTDGDLVVANGHGIDFSATSDSSGTGSTMSNELLDDYEEGSFTPRMRGTTSEPGTRITGTGLYVKVGTKCTITINFSNVNMAGYGGFVTIDQLPFGDGAILNAGAAGMLYNFSTADTDRQHSGYFIQSGVIYYYNIQNQSGWDQLTHTATSSMYYWDTITYITA